MKICQPVFKITGIVLIFLYFCCAKVPPEVILHSPKAVTQLKFQVQPRTPWGKHVMTYTVTFHGLQLLSTSPLGLKIKDGPVLDQNLKLLKTLITTGTETYRPIVGKHEAIEAHYQQVKISLATRSEPTYLVNLVFRAFDNGVAFRYELPQQPNLNDITITREMTGFKMANSFQAWVLPLDGFNTSYEANYQPTVVNRIDPKTLIGLPLTLMAQDQHTLAITEANIQNYAGMYLRRDPQDSLLLRTILAPWPSDTTIKVKGTLPLVSPWRVIMLGQSPGALIESELISNLNDPCVLPNTEWIHPGLVAWDWWANQIVKKVPFKGGMNTRTLLHYIDFAAEMGWEYMLIDAGWYGAHNDPTADITRPIAAVNLPRIIRDANKRKVGILLWLNWQNVERQMKVAFPLYEKWGVRGIKVDYMNRDDQWMVNFYQRVVALAAKHHLVVDFHGAFKPDGSQRTWPNLLTREGVLGLEYSKWSPRVTPEHDVTLPFTRMLAGPMDYTPGAFRNAARPEDFSFTGEPMSQGTRSHQLAMYIVYESPLQMCVDYPAAYRKQPGIEFLRYVPANWHDTRVLAGKIGDYVTIVRRFGNEWYLGSMTDWEPRSFEITLDFLGRGAYLAQIYADNLEPDKLATEPLIYEEKTVTPEAKLTLNLASGGGCAIRFKPQNN